MKDIIPFNEIQGPKESIQSLTEHNRIYCAICHRTEAVGLSGWYGNHTFVLKVGCHFCEARFEYRKSVFGIHESELCAYRNEFFAEALREFAVTIAGKEPSKNIYLLAYPKDVMKIARQLKIVWDRDKGGEILEKNEEGDAEPIQEDEDESA